MNYHQYAKVDINDIPGEIEAQKQKRIKRKNRKKKNRHSKRRKDKQ